MMKSLRKRHLQIWVLLTVLLPVAIVFAWLAIPNAEPIKLLQSSSVDLLPTIKSSVDKINYTANLRSNSEHTQWQLEWKNKLPLTVPSAVIYKVSRGFVKEGTSALFKTEDAVLIGRIEARGDYVFPLQTAPVNNDEWQLILFDFIHQKIIDSLTLKTSHDTRD